MTRDGIMVFAGPEGGLPSLSVGEFDLDPRTNRGRNSAGISAVVRPAVTSALVATLLLAVLALVAATVRLLPWLVEKDVPWQVIRPFGRGLASVALEAAVLVGFPLGFAWAASRFVERGEALVLASLGESPVRTTSRLVAPALVFGALLGAIAFVWGSDARGPGRIVDELVATARSACEGTRTRTSTSVPLAPIAWLCEPGAPPYIAGAPPSGFARPGGIVFAARGLDVSDDLRRLELDDATLAFRMPEGARASMGTSLGVHVRHFTLRGMAPWARASVLPPWARAVLVGSSAAFAALVAVFAVLSSGRKGRLFAVLVGSSGPVAVLATLRTLERFDAGPMAFVVLPVVSVVTASTVARLLVILGDPEDEGSTWARVLRTVRRVRGARARA
ncbi:MAG: hypothetical protein U0169_15065 [Polyangiaceae bacterium]